MWKLNRIIAENICAFRELDYTLQQGVTTLVFGDNRDNESQRSNGSGKSALIECVAVGITGSPLRKIKNEEIINDNADECFIRLQFTNDSSTEVFAVERQLFRKGASVASCTIERDGKPVETDEAVQPSVDAYNKYILEKLGITRDELFNNFILSKHKYQDFLSSSDKDKKDIINRFSNGIIVDEAIVKLQQDIAPIEAELKNAELEMAGIDGRIEMLVEQIYNEENSREEKTRTKVEKIATIENTISKKRTLIRERRTEIEALKIARTEITAMDKSVEAVENSDKPLEECLSEIKFNLSTTGTLTDWDSVIASKKERIYQAQTELSQLDNDTTQVETNVVQFTKSHTALKVEHHKFMDCSTKKSEGFKAELARLDSQITDINKLSTELKGKRRILSSAIESLSNQLAGTITCPACAHEFVVSDRDFDVIVGREELSKKKTELQSVVAGITSADNQLTTIESVQQEIQTSRRALNTQHSEWLQKIATAEKNMQTATYELETINRKQKQIIETITAIQNEIEGVRRKVFDEAFELIDKAHTTNQRKTKTLQEDIAAAECSIETLQTTIKELNNSTASEHLSSLKESLKSYRKKSSEAMDKKNEIEQELTTLAEQEQRFMQFRTFLANTKIEALSKITNEFLENIGSDIRIRFSGYTVLKTGKIREKISISLIRDGIDIGSYGKVSAGESTRLNVATILAMCELVNGNCDIDKGLDLLIIDELIDACDESGLSSMFSALNKLNMTALVVSHGSTAENYLYKLIIIKENGESKIE